MDYKLNLFCFMGFSYIKFYLNEFSFVGSSYTSNLTLRDF